MRDAIDGNLAFLHRFEERGLGLGRSAVDLVGEQDVGEDRSPPKLEVGGALIVDRGSRHVGGHQVRRELNALEVQAHRRREGTRQERFRHSRVVLDEQVAVGQQPHHDQLEHRALPDHRPFDLIENPACRRHDIRHDQIDSSAATMRSMACRLIAGRR